MNRNQYIFEVKISNTGPKGNENCAALKLPAPWGEFHDALQRARIEDGHHCRITVRKNHWEDLTPVLLGRPDDLYELNLLARRLTELTQEEAWAFDGLLKLETSRECPPYSLQRLINFTYNTDYFLFVPGGYHHGILGSYLYENKMLPEEAMRLLDTAEIGSIYRNRLLDAFGEKRANDRNGIVIPGGYAEPVDENWQEVYTPSEDEADYFIHAGTALVLEVTKGFFHDPAYDNDLRVHLALPASKDAVRDAVEAVGAVSVKACKFRCVDCLIPSLIEMINEAMDDASNPAPALETAELLRRKESQWSAEEFLKYKALLEASGCFDLADALGLMEGLEQYELYPTVAQPWDYAELVLREKYPDLPAELFQTGQSAEIGRKMLEEGRDTLTSYGLIRSKSGEPLPRFEREESEAMRME